MFSGKIRGNMKNRTNNASNFGLIKMYGKALLKDGFHGKMYHTPKCFFKNVMIALRS